MIATGDRTAGGAGRGVPGAGTTSPARSTRPSTTRPAAIQRIRERYGDARQAEIDGLSVDYDDWHFNVRSSNTEPLLRLNLESLVSEADMERRRDEVLEVILSG